jgi:hypothetical protein
MSVQDKNVIDIISIDANENVILTIADHLEWDSENEHLLMLQAKVNSYLESINGGDLYDQYPKAKGRNIVIRIVSLYKPNKEGEIFLERIEEFLAASGYGFQFHQQPMGEG